MEKNRASALGVDWTVHLEMQDYSGGNITLRKFDPSSCYRQFRWSKNGSRKWLTNSEDKYIVNLGHGILNIPGDHAKRLSMQWKEYNQ
jgi:uroporphyrinogen-III decarboxylase